MFAGIFDWTALPTAMLKFDASKNMVLLQNLQISFPTRLPQQYDKQSLVDSQDRDMKLRHLPSVFYLLCRNPNVPLNSLKYVVCFQPPM